MENKVRPQWPPGPHGHLKAGTWTQQPPQPVMTNSHQQPAKGTPILPSLLWTRTKRTAPGATGATGDCPLPEGMPLQRWLQPGQACRSALSPVTLWKWSLTHREVTIRFCGLNSPLLIPLSPFKCHFKLGIELLAAIRQILAQLSEVVPSLS